MTRRPRQRAPIVRAAGAGAQRRAVAGAPHQLRRAPRGRHWSDRGTIILIVSRREPCYTRRERLTGRDAISRTAGSSFSRKEQPTTTALYPLGPYHPALFQPIALRFKLRGEIIDHVEPPTMGFCRRGISELVVGKPLADALDLVERSCSFSAHSYRLAACRAIEAATDVAPSKQARLLRSLFAEIERILARLWTLGLAARAVALSAAFHDALEQRETLLELMEELTGERIFWALPQPGGVRQLEDETFVTLSAALDQLTAASATWRLATSTRGPLGRVGKGIGRLTPEQVAARELTGLAAYAVGVTEDTRRVAYEGYGDIDFEWSSEEDIAVPTGGDVAARLAAASGDLATSVRLARALLDAAREADASALLGGAAATASGREGQATVEGPHGQLRAACTLADADHVEQLQVHAPGATALLDPFPHALRGQPAALAPLILASLDLCAECVDL